jgi:tetratricopeptide (TPR) repeat protein
MAKGRKNQRLSQLWQFPLLILSLGLFAVAGYFFVHPQHRATLEEKVQVARNYLKQDRPDAALEQLNKILKNETVPPKVEGIIHLMLAEALEAGQNHLKISIPENYRRIIQQTQMALSHGVALDADIHRRLGESYAALGKVDEAINHYREAIALDGDHAVALRRKVIDLLYANDQTDAVEAEIDQYLAEKDLTPAEKSWALGQKSHMLIDRKEFAKAHVLLADALKLSTDTVEEGQFNYWLGYCAWKENDPAQAERLLRLARDQMKLRHPLDGDAAYLLGRIYQDRNDPETAKSFYEVTLVSHPDSQYALLAKLGRGICRIMAGDAEAGLTDLHDVTAEISSRPSRAAQTSAALAGLRTAVELLAGKENFTGALEVMAYEQQLEPAPTAGFYAKLGEMYERRANQIETSLPDLSDTDKIRRGEEVRQTRAKAGDAYIAYCRALTMLDDKGYGDALWHGIDLYDQAGDLQRTISALELFVAERPQDKLAPDALLRLGRAYQAAGLFSKAIGAFQRNQLEYPRSLAASKSAVPLAEAYIARGPDDFGKAEQVLLGVVDDNDLVDPNAEEFHQSLFALAQLYYRTGRYVEAINRLEEMTHRYPTDQQLPQLTFLMADSYRKSADVKLASAATGGNEIVEATSAKRDRLAKARELFDKVLELYSTAPPATEVDKLYQKLSSFYRADCLYDLGKYEDAIKAYETAAFRYQGDPTALAAYVQIVNSYCALGRPEEAKTANERAKWILRRMPADAFDNDSFSMPKKYWDDWLKWTSDSGMF